MTVETCVVKADIGEGSVSAKKGKIFEVIERTARLVTVNDPNDGKKYVLGLEDVTFPSTTSDEESSILDELLGDKPKKKPKKKKKKVKLGKNQIFFSSLTDGRLPASELDHVITIYPPKHFKEEMRDDIPEGDTHYRWDVEVLEMLVLSHKLNKKCLLTGLPGTGKSTAVKQYASIIQQPYMRFNGKDGIDPSSFLGYPWAGKDGMVWKDGLLPIGVLNGYLVTIDEVFKLPAGIQMAMQALYEQDGSLLLDDKPGTLADKHCHPHEDFRMFLTDNVRGTGDDFSKFASTQVQDTSTLDRFALMIEVDYLSVADEVKLLSGRYEEADPTLLMKLVKFAGLVRNGYREDNIAVTLSPRGLFTICELMAEGIPVKTAIQLAFSNKIAESSERVAIDSMLGTVGLGK